MKKLSIENKIENLAKVAEFIEEFGDNNGLNHKMVFELNLILDELVTNTISYGFKDDGAHTIDIIIEIDDNAIKMEMVDDGEEFNPLETKEVDLNKPLAEKSIGGLGIHFVKQKADKISYERKENKNILYVTKKLNMSENKNGN